MNKKDILYLLHHRPGYEIYWVDPDNGQEWMAAELVVEVKNNTAISRKFRQEINDMFRKWDEEYDKELKIMSLIREEEVGEIAGPGGQVIYFQGYEDDEDCYGVDDYNEFDCKDF